jgi:hypothetical protein
METRRLSVVLETLPRTFVQGQWFENVEVRVEWTETKVAPHFPFRSDKHYVRAYASGQIIEHVFEPYKSVGAAKRRARDFISALRAYAERKARTQAHADLGRNAG